MAGLSTGAPIVKVYHEKSMILPDVSRVLACLYEKDIKFERETYSYKDLLRLQASTRTPVPFYDGPIFLEESRAICHYIAKTYEHRGYPYLLGKDVLERASVEKWLHNEEHSFNPPSRALFCHLAFPLDEKDGYIDAEKRKLEEVLEVYEQRLSESEFLAGNKCTLADLMHLPNSHYITKSNKFAYLYDSRKNVQRWWNAISTRDSWKQVLNDMERVEQQHKPEELLTQQHGRKILIDSRKQIGTTCQTIWVPPLASTSIQTSSESERSLPTKTYSNGSTDMTPQKSPTFAPATSPTIPSTAETTPITDSDKSSTKDTSLQPATQRHSDDDQKAAPPPPSQGPTSRGQRASTPLRGAIPGGDKFGKISIIDEWRRASTSSSPIQEVAPSSSDGEQDTSAIDQKPAPYDVHASHMHDQEAAAPTPDGDKFGKLSIIDEWRRASASSSPIQEVAPSSGDDEQDTSMIDQKPTPYDERASHVHDQEATAPTTKTPEAPTSSAPQVVERIKEDAPDTHGTIESIEPPSSSKEQVSDDSRAPRTSKEPSPDGRGTIVDEGTMTTRGRRAQVPDIARDSPKLPRDALRTGGDKPSIGSVHDQSAQATTTTQAPLASDAQQDFASTQDIPADGEESLKTPKTGQDAKVSPTSPMPLPEAQRVTMTGEDTTRSVQPSSYAKPRKQETSTAEEDRVDPLQSRVGEEVPPPTVVQREAPLSDAMTTPIQRDVRGTGDGDPSKASSRGQRAPSSTSVQRPIVDSQLSSAPIQEIIKDTLENTEKGKTTSIDQKPAPYDVRASHRHDQEAAAPTRDGDKFGKLSIIDEWRRASASPSPIQEVTPSSGEDEQDTSVIDQKSTPYDERASHVPDQEAATHATRTPEAPTSSAPHVVERIKKDALDTRGTIESTEPPSSRKEQVSDGGRAPRTSEEPSPGDRAAIVDEETMTTQGRRVPVPDVGRDSPKLPRDALRIGGDKPSKRSMHDQSKQATATTQAPLTSDAQQDFASIQDIPTDDLVREESLKTPKTSQDAEISPTSPMPLPKAQRVTTTGEDTTRSRQPSSYAKPRTQETSTAEEDRVDPLQSRVGEEAPPPTVVQREAPLSDAATTPIQRDVHGTGESDPSKESSRGQRAPSSTSVQRPIVDSQLSSAPIQEIIEDTLENTEKGKTTSIDQNQAPYDVRASHKHDRDAAAPTRDGDKFGKLSIIDEWRRASASSSLIQEVAPSSGEDVQDTSVIDQKPTPYDERASHVPDQEAATHATRTPEAPTSSAPHVVERIKKDAPDTRGTIESAESPSSRKEQVSDDGRAPKTSEEPSPSDRAAIVDEETTMTPGRRAPVPDVGRDSPKLPRDALRTGGDKPSKGSMHDQSTQATATTQAPLASDAQQDFASIQDIPTDNSVREESLKTPKTGQDAEVSPTSPMPLPKAQRVTTTGKDMTRSRQPSSYDKPRTQETSTAKEDRVDPLQSRVGEEAPPPTVVQREAPLSDAATTPIQRDVHGTDESDPSKASSRGQRAPSSTSVQRPIVDSQLSSAPIQEIIEDTLENTEKGKTTSIDQKPAPYDVRASHRHDRDAAAPTHDGDKFGKLSIIDEWRRASASSSLIQEVAPSSGEDVQDTSVIDQKSTPYDEHASHVPDQEAATHATRTPEAPTPSAPHVVERIKKDAPDTRGTIESTESPSSRKDQVSDDERAPKTSKEPSPSDRAAIVDEETTTTRGRRAPVPDVGRDSPKLPGDALRIGGDKPSKGSMHDQSTQVTATTQAPLASDAQQVFSSIQDIPTNDLVREESLKTPKTGQDAEVSPTSPMPLSKAQRVTMTGEDTTRSGKPSSYAKLRTQETSTAEEDRDDPLQSRVGEEAPPPIVVQREAPLLDAVMTPIQRDVRGTGDGDPSKESSHGQRAPSATSAQQPIVDSQVSSAPIQEISGDTMDNAETGKTASIDQKPAPYDVRASHMQDREATTPTPNGGKFGKLSTLDEWRSASASSSPIQELAPSSGEDEQDTSVIDQKPTPHDERASHVPDQEAVTHATRTPEAPTSSVPHVVERMKTDAPDTRGTIESTEPPSSRKEQVSDDGRAPRTSEDPSPSGRGAIVDEVATTTRGRRAQVPDVASDSPKLPGDAPRTGGDEPSKRSAHDQSAQATAPTEAPLASDAQQDFPSIQDIPAAGLVREESLQTPKTSQDAEVSPTSPMPLPEAQRVTTTGKDTTSFGQPSSYAELRKQEASTVEDDRASPLQSRVSDEAPPPAVVQREAPLSDVASTPIQPDVRGTGDGDTSKTSSRGQRGPSSTSVQRPIVDSQVGSAPIQEISGDTLDNAVMGKTALIDREVAAPATSTPEAPTSSAPLVVEQTKEDAPDTRGDIESTVPPSSGKDQASGDERAPGTFEEPPPGGWGATVEEETITTQGSIAQALDVACDSSKLPRDALHTGGDEPFKRSLHDQSAQATAPTQAPLPSDAQQDFPSIQDIPAASLVREESLKTPKTGQDAEVSPTSPTPLHEAQRVTTTGEDTSRFGQPSSFAEPRKQEASTVEDDRAIPSQSRVGAEAPPPTVVQREAPLLDAASTPILPDVRGIGDGDPSKASSRGQRGPSSTSVQRPIIDSQAGSAPIHEISGDTLDNAEMGKTASIDREVAAPATTTPEATTSSAPHVVEQTKENSPDTRCDIKSTKLPSSGKEQASGDGRAPGTFEEPPPSGRGATVEEETMMTQGSIAQAPDIARDSSKLPRDALYTGGDEPFKRSLHDQSTQATTPTQAPLPSNARQDFPSIQDIPAAGLVREESLKTPKTGQDADVAPTSPTPLPEAQRVTTTGEDTTRSGQPSSYAEPRKQEASNVEDDRAGPSQSRVGDEAPPPTVVQREAPLSDAASTPIQPDVRGTGDGDPSKASSRGQRGPSSTSVQRPILDSQAGSAAIQEISGDTLDNAETGKTASIDQEVAAPTTTTPEATTSSAPHVVERTKEDAPDTHGDIESTEPSSSGKEQASGDGRAPGTFEEPSPGGRGAIVEEETTTTQGSQAQAPDVACDSSKLPGDVLHTGGDELSKRSVHDQSAHATAPTQAPLASDAQQDFPSIQNIPTVGLVREESLKTPKTGQDAEVSQTSPTPLPEAQRVAMTGEDMTRSGQPSSYSKSRKQEASTVEDDRADPLQSRVGDEAPPPAVVQREAPLPDAASTPIQPDVRGTGDGDSSKASSHGQRAPSSTSGQLRIVDSQFGSSPIQEVSGDTLDNVETGKTTSIDQKPAPYDVRASLIQDREAAAPTLDGEAATHATRTPEVPTLSAPHVVEQMNTDASDTHGTIESTKPPSSRKEQVSNDGRAPRTSEEPSLVGRDAIVDDEATTTRGRRAPVPDITSDSPKLPGDALRTDGDEPSKRSVHDQSAQATTPTQAPLPSDAQQDFSSIQDIPAAGLVREKSLKTPKTGQDAEVSPTSPTPLPEAQCVTTTGEDTTRSGQPSSYAEPRKQEASTVEDDRAGPSQSRVGDEAPPPAVVQREAPLSDAVLTAIQPDVRGIGDGDPSKASSRGQRGPSSTSVKRPIVDSQAGSTPIQEISGDTLDNAETRKTALIDQEVVATATKTPEALTSSTPHVVERTKEDAPDTLGDIESTEPPSSGKEQASGDGRAPGKFEEPPPGGQGAIVEEETTTTQGSRAQAPDVARDSSKLPKDALCTGGDELSKRSMHDQSAHATAPTQAPLASDAQQDFPSIQDIPAAGLVREESLKTPKIGQDAGVSPTSPTPLPEAQRVTTTGEDTTRSGQPSSYTEPRKQEANTVEDDRASPLQSRVGEEAPPPAVVQREAPLSDAALTPIQLDVHGTGDGDPSKASSCGQRGPSSTSVQRPIVDSQAVSAPIQEISGDTLDNAETGKIAPIDQEVAAPATTTPEAPTSSAPHVVERTKEDAPDTHGDIESIEPPSSGKEQASGDGRAPGTFEDPPPGRWGAIVEEETLTTQGSRAQAPDVARDSSKLPRDALRTGGDEPSKRSVHDQSAQATAPTQAPLSSDAQQDFPSIQDIPAVGLVREESLKTPKTGQDAEVSPTSPTPLPEAQRVTTTGEDITHSGQPSSFAEPRKQEASTVEDDRAGPSQSRVGDKAPPPAVVQREAPLSDAASTPIQPNVRGTGDGDPSKASSHDQRGPSSTSGQQSIVDSQVGSAPIQEISGDTLDNAKTGKTALIDREVAAAATTTLEAPTSSAPDFVEQTKEDAPNTRGDIESTEPPLSGKELASGDGRAPRTFEEPPPSGWGAIVEEETTKTQGSRAQIPDVARDSSKLPGDALRTGGDEPSKRSVHDQSAQATTRTQAPLASDAQQNLSSAPDVSADGLNREESPTTSAADHEASVFPTSPTSSPNTHFVTMPEQDSARSGQLASYAKPRGETSAAETLQTGVPQTTTEEGAILLAGVQRESPRSDAQHASRKIQEVAHGVDHGKKSMKQPIQSEEQSSDVGRAPAATSPTSILDTQRGTTLDEDSARSAQLPSLVQPRIEKTNVVEADESNISQTSISQEAIPPAADSREALSSDTHRASRKVQEGTPDESENPMTGTDSVQPQQQASFYMPISEKNTVTQANTLPNGNISWASQAVGKSERSAGYGAPSDSSNYQKNLTPTSADEKFELQQQTDQSITQPFKDNDKKVNETVRSVRSSVLTTSGEMQTSPPQVRMEATEEPKQQPQADQLAVQSAKDGIRKVEETETWGTGSIGTKERNFSANTNQKSSGKSQVEALDQSEKQATGAQQLSNNTNNSSKSIKETPSDNQVKNKSEKSVETSEEPKQQLQTDQPTARSPHGKQQGDEIVASTYKTEQPEKKDFQANTNQNYNNQSQPEASDKPEEQTSSSIQQLNNNRNNSKLDGSTNAREPDNMEGNPPKSQRHDSSTNT